jgi:serine phosphatase RsbU (regulator of sigma subunit)
MKILLAWDDANEAELLRLYLTAGEHEVELGRSAAEVAAKARPGAWDAVLMAVSFPGSADGGYALFRELQRAVPGLPVVAACRDGEVVGLPRFLAHGLRSYLLRDPQGDFIFLALSALESAVAAAHAEEAQKLADRLREEMDGVRRMQELIIPQGFKPPAGYRAAARYEPSQVQVLGGRPVVLAGGDYYDLFCPDDRTLVVLLGDASGHGLKACMSIMAMHTLIRMIPGDRYRDTGAFVAEINERLCSNSIVQSDGGFITLFYAAIDTVTHTMTWTSAGHPLPLLHRVDTGEVREIGTAEDGGLPLGVCPGVDYTSATLELPPGAQVLLYTDGLADAFCPQGKGHQAFGARGIAESLRACDGAAPEAIVARLLGDSKAFTNGTGRHDDTSVVVVERLVGGAPRSTGHAVKRQPAPVAAGR